MISELEWDVQHELIGSEGRRWLRPSRAELAAGTIRWARHWAGRALPFGDVLWTLWEEIGEAQVATTVALGVVWQAWQSPGVLVTAEGGEWVVLLRPGELEEWEVAGEMRQRSIRRRLTQRGWGLEGAKRATGRDQPYVVGQARQQLQMLQRMADEVLLAEGGAELVAAVDRAAGAVVGREQAGQAPGGLLIAYQAATRRLAAARHRVAVTLPPPHLLFRGAPECPPHGGGWEPPWIFRRDDLGALRLRNDQVAAGTLPKVRDGDRVGAAAALLAAQHVGQHRFMGELKLTAGSPRVETLLGRCVRDGTAVRSLFRASHGYLYTFCVAGEGQAAAGARQLDFIYEKWGLDDLWAAVTRAAGRDPESVQLGRCADLARRMPELRRRYPRWAVLALDRSVGQGFAEIGGAEERLMAPDWSRRRPTVMERKRFRAVRDYVDAVMACAVTLGPQLKGDGRELRRRLVTPGVGCQPTLIQVVADEYRGRVVEGVPQAEQVTMQVETGLELAVAGGYRPHLAEVPFGGWQALEAGAARGPFYVATPEAVGGDGVALLWAEVPVEGLGGIDVVAPWPVGPDCCAPWLGVAGARRLRWLHRVDPVALPGLPRMMSAFPATEVTGWVEVEPLGLLLVPDTQRHAPGFRGRPTWCLLLGVGQRGLAWDVWRGGRFVDWLGLPRQAGPAGAHRLAGESQLRGGLSADERQAVDVALPLLSRGVLGRVARL